MAENGRELQSGLHDNPNIIWVGQAGFEADNDRVIVLQDDFLSGFECPTCLDRNKRTVAGKECSTIDCPNCGGKGKYEREGRTIKCSECSAAGWVVCPDCNGLGGTIVVPEDRKGQPTTGTIVSVGPLVGRTCIHCSGNGVVYDFDPNQLVPGNIVQKTKHLCSVCDAKGIIPTRKRGDKVIYPSFAGHAYDLKGYDEKEREYRVVLVVLRDQEIISRMYGKLEQNQVKRSAALHTAA